MYRRILWCYVFGLSLLDISLNTKSSALGKSHGVAAHGALVEGITFQEWGADGAGGAAGALRLAPAALRFGRAALGAAHHATVTVTNAANATLHLASVAGTTPDFHASFFDAKTLPPDGNTTFGVVFVGRREGAARALLYLHTSRGVHKYPVSAEGVASEWGVWPLLGVRVPANASVAPELTLHNPTERAVQVREVRSSGAWLRLQLPAGGDSAPRAAWTLPPRSTRALVRLLIEPPHAHHALTAYVRIQADVPGGALLVAVEARAAPPGEHAAPLQLRLRTRGSRDPPHTWDLELGNSLEEEVRVEAALWGARCESAPPPGDAPPGPAAAANGAAGGKRAGARLALLQPLLEPRQPLRRAATLTLDYAELWESYAAGARGDAGAQAWCSGWVRLGRAALPYSVRVLPGTLVLLPDTLDFVMADREEALRERELRVRNEFAVPVRVTHLQHEPDVHEHFEVEFVGAELAPGATALVARVRLRRYDAALRVDARLALYCNVSRYEVPLRAFRGALRLEWEWPGAAGGDGELRLGALGTSVTRRVPLRLHNPAPRVLCVTALRAQLPGATLALHACAHLRAVPDDHACRCVPAGARAQAWLTLVAPAREGALRGAVAVSTPHATTEAAVSLRAHSGRLAAAPLHFDDAAPYAWASAELVLESSMALRMRVIDVSQRAPDAALSFEAREGAGAEVRAGRQAVGVLRYAPERLCAPRCSTGLDVASEEGVAWVARAEHAWHETALRADAALLRERRARHEDATRNVSLHVHTTQVLQVPAAGAVRLRWPRLLEAGGAGAGAALAGVGGAATLRLAARNPSRSHALLLQPVLGPALPELPPDAGAPCVAEACAEGADVFALGEWRGARAWGAAGEGAAGAGRALPVLLLAPGARVELRVTFAPREARAYSAHLYLRNNLTVLEAVPLAGRGAVPSFELAGRAPGAGAPLLFEVEDCGGGAVRRTLLVRNTGRVAVRLRDWRVAGRACQARGFRVAPCASLTLAPNETRPLSVAFAADWTLARVAAALELRTDLGGAAFPLRAAVPARLLRRCRAAAPRAPWEPALRAAGAALALALLALMLAAGALDAERLLRRARAARAPPPPRAPAPLDLRALAAAAAPSEPAPASRAPPAPAPRRRRARRLDPLAESRAFERWRASLRGADSDDSSQRSSEDADNEDSAGAAPHPAPAAPPTAPAAAPPEPPSSEDSADDSSDPRELELLELEHEREHAPRSRSPPARTPSPAAPPPADAAEPQPRGAKLRREAGEAPRRPERRAAEAEAPRRALAGKHHARKDKLSKRRASAGAGAGCGAAAARCSPPAGGEARPGAGAAPPVRWGATWSSVVARAPPAAAAAPAPALPPIGSDVRRRASPSADHSLFYFNGEQAALGARPEPEFSWRAPTAPAAAPEPRSAFGTPVRDFLEGARAGGAYGSIGGGVWAGSLEARAPGAWPWPAYSPPAPAHAPPGPGPAAPVRPPPGFGAAPPAGARPVRAFDPFHSLASIWTRTALDWRAADDAEH